MKHDHKRIPAGARAFAALADEGSLDEDRGKRKRHSVALLMIVVAIFAVPVFMAAAAFGSDAGQQLATTAKAPGPGHDGDGDDGDGDDGDDDNSGPGGPTDRGGEHTSGAADTLGTTGDSGASQTQSGTDEQGVTDLPDGDTSANGDDTAGTTAGTGASVTQQGTNEGGHTDHGDTSDGGQDTAGTTAGTGASVTNE